MSTVTAGPTLHADVPTPMRSRPASLATLSAVELRKAVDTRAGRWLLIVVGILALGGTAITLFAVPSEERTFDTFFRVNLMLTQFVLPVVGILLITSEWSQRSALTTFSLVPRRSRILVAKLVAALTIAVVGWAAGFVLAGLGTALASHPTGPDTGQVWGLTVGHVLASLLWAVLSMALGVALGLAFLNTAAAIVLNFVLPLAWTILASLVSALSRLQPWLDTNVSWTYLLTPDLSGQHWAQIVVTTAVWVLLPGTIGAYRMLTREVS